MADGPVDPNHQSGFNQVFAGAGQAKVKTKNMTKPGRVIFTDEDAETRRRGDAETRGIRRPSREKSKAKRKAVMNYRTPKCLSCGSIARRVPSPWSAIFA